MQINYEKSENFKVKAEFKLLVGNVILRGEVAPRVRPSG